MRTAYPFRFGTLIMEYDGEMLERLLCVETEYEITAIETEQRSEFSDRVYAQVNEYLAGQRMSFDFGYRLAGTEFQKKVWEELCRIPYGETRSYKEIAEAIGNPGAGRAVGMANNKNPLLLVIPCHRVIGADGSLTGYAGGLAMKKYLLELEKEHAYVKRGVKPPPDKLRSSLHS
ncbi:MAG: methylated-DNA--[protein]-cysteine S-methyltransferase [Lachnospiraceae bacterium]|nr:methylated-DNA--[protein]-cysteine S-methyltransferase [Lachnospiraceae bacterium]